MKKDLVLLSVLSAAIALTCSIAAARGAIAIPAAWNPLETWTTRKCVVAFAIAFVATLISGAAIAISDRGLPHNSAILEWVYSSDEAARIVAAYGERRMQAVRGVLIDSVAFIPSYVLLIAIASFWLGRGQPLDHWTAAVVAIGWCVVFAGALDYVENAGILAALTGVTTRVAPLTYVACQWKWLIALSVADFAIIVALVRALCR
jgi:hypothetical protein